MKGQNFIHIKLDYEEVLQGKMDTLYSEEGLIKVARIIKNYQNLRLKELKLKLRTHKIIKETALNIKNLENILPEIEIQSIHKEKEKRILKEFRGLKQEKKYDLSLENQLRDIQKKLKELER